MLNFMNEKLDLFPGWLSSSLEKFDIDEFAYLFWGH